MTGLLPELLFYIFEFPLSTILTWTAFNYYMSSGWFSFLLYLIVGPPLFIGGIIFYLYIGSRLAASDESLAVPYSDWIVLKDPEVKAKWAGKKLPMREAYEWYFLDKIEFTHPTLEVFLHRHDLFRFIFTEGHLHEIVWGVLGKSVFKHDAEGDASEVQPVYNLGNDFYHAFLADPMFYSCGVAYDSSDSLETAQARKCGICCELLDVKDGDRILDFGCGWGSWLIYCAKNFDVTCVGMTISTSQFEWATRRQKEEKLEHKIQFLLLDYREIKVDIYQQFDKITCFEMSEHVGIRNYQNFMAQVKSLLKPDGLFFLQIAGLRRQWKFEDLIWGIFMGKYIFPGADASCPLYWDISMLERGGFEVQTVRNQGVHYAHTIEMWYHNIVKNKEQVLKQYGVFAYRLHELFLAWSTMIARQGSSTVWLIVSTHQHPVDVYTVPKGSKEAEKYKLNRSKQFIRKDRYTTKF